MMVHADYALIADDAVVGAPQFFHVAGPAILYRVGLVLELFGHGLASERLLGLLLVVVAVNVLVDVGVLDHCDLRRDLAGAGDLVHVAWPAAAYLDVALHGACSDEEEDRGLYIEA